MDEALRYLVQSQPPAYLLSERALGGVLSPPPLIEASWWLALKFASKANLSLPEKDTSRYGLWAGISAFIES